MTGFRWRHLALGVSWPALAACGSDEPFEPARPFDDPEAVAVWATAASAVGVYSNVYQLIAVYDGHQTYPDVSCPTLEMGDATMSVTGGCTDTLGTEWTGSATVDDNAGELTLTLEDFDHLQGTFTLTPVERAQRLQHDFEAHFVSGGVTTIDYSGSVDGDYDTATIWNGSGHVERQGVFEPVGAVDATTLNEVVDDACMGQPFSGTTTLEAGDDTAVITYDGESDCDDDKKAQLSVNGEERGEIDGITCAVMAAGAPGGRRSSLVLLAFASLAAFRRRSRPTTWTAGRRCGAPLERSATCRCKA
jgi:hypothetical protein